MTAHSNRRSGEERRNDFESCPKYHTCNFSEKQIEAIVTKVLRAHEESIQTRMFVAAESKIFEKIGRLFAAKFFILIGVIIVVIFTIAKQLKLIDS